MKVYPIVIAGENSVYNEAASALKAIHSGADGIYLSNRNAKNNDIDLLFETYNLVANEIHDRYIGIHISNTSPLKAVHLVANALGRRRRLESLPSGLWVDDMRADLIDQSSNITIDGLCEEQLEASAFGRVVNSTELVKKLRDSAIEFRDKTPALEGLRLLGGIAYKNTAMFTEDPIKAVYETAWLGDSVDAIVTSGKTSSHKPSVEKLVAMKGFTGGKPIAVVGGISINDAADYNGLADELIVLNGFETHPGSGRLDHNKLSDLVKIAHNF